MKRYFCNLIDVLCLLSCGVFACIVTDTVPEQVLESMTQPLWITLGVAAFLLLVFPRLTKMVWNVIFCLASMVLYTGIMAWATQGVVVPMAIGEFIEPYGIPALLEQGEYYTLGSFALLWVLGGLCCLGFWRVTLTALGCYAVWLLMSLGLHIGVRAWLNMEAPPLAGSQSLLVRCPWLTAAIPGAFVVVYGVLMSMYDGFFTPWPRSSKKKEAPEAAAEQKPAPAPVAAAAPAQRTAPVRKKTAAKPVLKTASAAAAAPKAEPKPEPSPAAEPKPEPAAGPAPESSPAAEPAPETAPAAEPGPAPAAEEKAEPAPTTDKA